MIRALALLSLLLCALAPRASAQDLDLTKMVSAPGYAYLGDGVKVGYRMERETIVAGNKTREFIAVVGETEDAWEIESSQGLGGYATLPNGVGEGLVYALVVDKKTLKVLTARLGKVGGALGEIKILEQAKGPKDTEPAKPERTETLELKSGKKIEVEVYVNEIQGKTYTSKAGKKGTPYEGVLLDYQGATPAESFSLEGDPSQGTHELEDTDAEGKAKALETITVRFSNGYTYTYSDDPVAKALYSQVIKIESKSFTAQVVSLRTDAKKTLNWK